MAEARAAVAEAEAAAVHEAQASAAELTVSKTDADQLTVSIVSTNDKAIDVLIVNEQPTGATVSSPRYDNGVAQVDLSWAAGTMPADASFQILWSKEDFGGNWMLV